VGELGGGEVGFGGVEDPEVLVEAGDRRGLVAPRHVGRHRLFAAHPTPYVPNFTEILTDEILRY
jgi:hypothetical protein